MGTILLIHQLEDMLLSQKKFVVVMPFVDGLALRQFMKVFKLLGER